MSDNTWSYGRVQQTSNSTQNANSIMFFQIPTKQIFTKQWTILDVSNSTTSNQ